MSTKRLIPLVLAVLAAVALVATGCGSSKKSISKAEFLRKGNAICAQGNKEIQAEAQKRFPNQKGRPSNAQLKSFATEVVIPSVEKQVSKLKDLGAPKGDKDKVNAIWAAADEGIAKTKQDPLSVAVENGGPFAKANKLANAYGLKVCGSS